jgi:uncharacterized protein (TIGR02001 family)
MGLVAVPALAAEPVGGAVVLTSDYVFRGVSQSDGAAAAQADVHLRSARGWFAGVWTSTADPPPGNVGNYEINLYAGRSWDLSERWAASVSYVRYFYPNSPAHGRYDADEVSVSLKFDDRLALTAAVSPNATRYSSYGWAARGRALSYEASLRQPALRPVSIIAAVGYYDTQALFRASYWAWNAGFSAQAGPVEFTLNRFGVDATGRRLFDTYAADGRWALSATWRF